MLAFVRSFCFSVREDSTQYSKPVFPIHFILICVSSTLDPVSASLVLSFCLKLLAAAISNNKCSTM